MSGLLLDPYTGQPQGVADSQIVSPRGVPFTMEDNYRNGWRGGELSDTRPDYDLLPDSVQKWLRLSSGKEGPFAGMRPPMNDHSNYEVLRYWITADTTLSGSSAEQIMVPAFSFGPSELNVGASLHMTLIGSQSLAVTTPGTIIERMRWGGVAGALQATSSTNTPTTTATVTSWSVISEYWMTVRTTGAAGTLWCQGTIDNPGTIISTATVAQVVTYLLNQQVPASVAAIGAAIDFTASLGPTPTYQSSVTTSTRVTHLALLELMN